ncbi:MAG: recombinase RecT [Armatimonadota bacterium]
MDKERIAAALGNGANVDRYLAGWQRTISELKSIGASDELIENAIAECASMGLTPALDHVAIVPMRDDKGRIVNLEVRLTARGILVLVMRSPNIKDVEVQLVHKSDTYKFENGVLVHSYDPFAGDREIAKPDDIVGGYVKITYRDGYVRYHCVPVSKIEKNRACARRQDVWQTWYREMAAKTVIIDAFARGVFNVDLDTMQNVYAAVQHEYQQQEATPNPIYGKDEDLVESYLEAIEQADSVADLNAVAQRLISDNALSDDAKAKLRAAWSAKKQQLSAETPPEDDAPKQKTELEASIEKAETPAELARIYESLTDLPRDEAVRLRALADEKLRSLRARTGGRSNGQ